MRGFLGLAMAAAIALGGAALAAPLNAPFDVEAARAAVGKPPKKKFVCDAPPEAVLSVETVSKYAPGTDSTEIDPEREASYRALTKRLRAFSGPLAKLANAYVATNPADGRIAACALDWLAAWAKADAARAPEGRSGEAVRAQLLASSAMAYVQIRGESALSADARAEVEAWLRRLSARVMADFSAHGDLPSRNNNHIYWAGWAVMAGAIATNDSALFAWGLAAGRKGAAAVDADGFLPLELERRQRALGYHFYAAEALVLIAEAARANGEDLYGAQDGAIARLARTALEGWNDPSAFAARTGYEQDKAFVSSGGKVAWALILARRYPELALVDWRGLFSGFSSLAAGGDTDLLYSAGGR